MPHFANKYIGQSWVAGAQGPDVFDSDIFFAGAR